MDSVLTLTSTPPPIPGTWSDSTGHFHRPLLVWVRTGTAHVHVDDTLTFRLTAGQGAWIPADGWEHRAITTEPGTVAFPLLSHPGARSPSEPTRFEVPDDGQDWLIQHFNLQNTPISGRGYRPGEVTDLLLRPAPTPPAPAHGTKIAPAASLPELTMPKAGGAKTVAEELTRDPSLDLTVEQWAAQVLCSPRTLRRGFLAGSGLTFERWRLRCRLTAAVQLLSAGYGVDQVTVRVGFVSHSGLTRAFKQQFGLTPYEMSREFSANCTTGETAQRAAVARQADDLLHIARQDGTGGAPSLLPAARTPAHTNNSHVLSWMYRGSGYLDIGGHRYERQRGVATWIPAGVEHTTGLRENSISLPIGDASTADLHLTEPLQVKFPPAWDDYLMYCSISARSVLRPVSTAKLRSPLVAR